METAVTLLMDGQPLIAERVAIFGQGVVGLLTTALLAQFPVAALVTLAPEHTGRWTKARRVDVAWQMLQRVDPARLITHHFPIAQAARAFLLLDERPQEAIFVVLTYE